MITYLPMFLNLLGWFTYLFMMYKNEGVTPHPLPWLMSLIIVVTSVLASLSSPSQLGVYVVGLVLNIVFLVFSVWKYNKVGLELSISNNDKWLLLTCFAVLVFYLATKSSIFTCLYCLGVCFMGIRLIVELKSNEPLLPWVIWSVTSFVAFGINIQSKDVDMNVLLLSLTNIICWTSTMLTVLYISKIKKLY